MSSSSLLLPVIVVSEETLARLRGRKCWFYLYMALSLVFSAAFSIYVFHYSESLKRSIFAFLSIFICYQSVNIWYYLFSKDGKFISNSLSVKFFLRGAFLSILIAILLEVMESKELTPNRQSQYWVLPLALTAGFAEEVGKLVLVIIGLRFTPPLVPGMWTMFVESPRGLAFAGFAVGLGFMTTENLEYFYGPLIMASDSMLAVLFVLRTVLNLHPYLTGLSAARLAATCFPIGRVSVGRVVAAIWPSVLIHAMYDFGLMLSMSDRNTSVTGPLIIISLLLIPAIIILFARAYRALPQIE